MNRTKQNEIKFNLIAWRDSDIPEMIIDCSFSGKLMPKPIGSENQNEAPSSQVSVKKKRAPKKSILTSTENTQDNEISNMLGSISEKNNEKEIKNNISKLGNHFQFGNQIDTTMNKTSNNKLDQSLRISYAEMAKTLEEYKPGYTQSVEKINQMYEENYFPEWYKLLNNGFNILLHGVGSKKKLLENFCEKFLHNSYYIILLGYHHDLNAKNLLKSILNDVLELNEGFKTFDEQLNAINQNLKTDLYLVIHNIDGNCMRDCSVQYWLSELATNKFIHFIASVDHINSGLLWDNMQFVSLKWLHYETNTLVSYYDEIMFENSLMLNQTGNVQLSSMIHILKSLTPNAKKIFLSLVEYVLDKENVKKNMTFTKLYHECREKFYVSNELTLRAQLTEFIDHKLIKLKTEADGYETIYVLIDDTNLKLFLEDLKDKV